MVTKPLTRPWEAPRTLSAVKLQVMACQKSEGKAGVTILRFGLSNTTFQIPCISEGIPSPCGSLGVPPALDAFHCTTKLRSIIFGRLIVFVHMQELPETGSVCPLLGYVARTGRVFWKKRFLVFHRRSKVEKQTSASKGFPL